MTEPVIVRNPRLCSGEPVVAGTRVFVEDLFRSLEDGDSIADFLDEFGGVT